MKEGSLKKPLIALVLLLTLQSALLAGRANASKPTYVFPVQGCPTTYAHSHHDYPATDIILKKPHPAKCYFVATTTGFVDEVRRVDHWRSKTNKGADRGGISISIVGDDGVRYYGSHLKSIEPGLEHGTRVNAGDRLGVLGNSGDARGVATHLHYGISWPTAPGAWWIRRGELYPWRYLDAWRKGIAASPATAVAKLHAKLGDLPPCTKGC